MFYQQQGALITILEAQKDMHLVNEAEEKSGTVSEKKPERIVHTRCSRCLMSFLRLQGN